MLRLYLILYKYRAFLSFLLIEFVCWWLIVQNNQYQSAAFFNSSNHLAGTIYSIRNNVTEYLNLKDVNRNLADENAQLRQQLFNNQVRLSSPSIESSVLEPHLSLQYQFLPTKVINNSIHNYDNYLTLNRGSLDGIEPGMGVISTRGVVGKVKATSKHYSTVTSLLHSDVMISSVLEGSNTFCTTKWDGRSPGEAELLYVPRHQKIELGDSVVTSGFNSVFPEDVMIGTISEIGLPENATFYEVKIQLSTDFNALSYTYVCINKLRFEKDSIELNTYYE